LSDLGLFGGTKFTFVPVFTGDAHSPS